MSDRIAQGPTGALDRAAAWLSTRVRGWTAAAALLLFVLFVAVVLPAQAAAGAFYTEVYDAPDTRWWYTSADLYAAAEAWGEPGRSAYVRARWTFDVIWPIVYGGFLLSGLTWSWTRATAAGSRWRRVTLLPVLVVLLDYAENVCTATVMARYPARTPVLADLAPLFTAAKWLTLTTCFVLLAVGLVAALVTAVRRRTRR